MIFLDNKLNAPMQGKQLHLNSLQPTTIFYVSLTLGLEIWPFQIPTLA